MGAGMSSYNTNGTYFEVRKEVANQVDSSFKSNLNNYLSGIQNAQEGRNSEWNTNNINNSIKSMGGLEQYYKIDHKNSEKLLEDTLLSMSEKVDPDIGLKIHLNKGAIEERTVQTMALQSIIQQIKESYRRQSISFWVYIVFIIVLLVASYLLHNVVYIHTHRS